MPTRCTTTEYQPAPPITRLSTVHAGDVKGGVSVKTIASSAAIKNNVGCAPATNGDRETGHVAASSYASATAGKVIRKAF